MGSNPQESLENPINTMDTLLGVHLSLSLDQTAYIGDPGVPVGKIEI